MSTVMEPKKQEPDRSFVERREGDNPGARERILRASYDLFSGRGIRDVSIDEVIAASDVAKATLYRHFPSKDELVLAFLSRREQVWTYDMVEAGAVARASDPEGRLLAIFDVFNDWFQEDNFEACSFINVLLEMGLEHPAGRASTQYLANIRTVVEKFATDAGLRDTDEFARSWHILMKGSIVQAAEGDRQAAKRAQGMARLLIEQFRPAAA
ncbi:MAG: TetR family transcriptional regulator [Homoserinimonas sp.]|jgi:AcrR family transcriptional regulator|nr:TetR family transcriptional regulator [Homoserinimonas sp.]